MKFSKFIKRTTLNNRCQRRRCFKSIAILACSQCSLGLGGTMKPLVEFRVKNPGNSSYLKVFINARKKLILDYSLPRQYFKISKLQLRKLPCKIIEWCRNLYFKNQLTILTGKNCFTQFSTRNGWLAASDLFRMLTKSVKLYISNNAINQMNSKNDWLLLSASFTAKLGLVFVLTLENAFS